MQLSIEQGDHAEGSIHLPQDPGQCQGCNMVSRQDPSCLPFDVLDLVPWKLQFHGSRVDLSQELYGSLGLRWTTWGNRLRNLGSLGGIQLL